MLGETTCSLFLCWSSLTGFSPQLIGPMIFQTQWYLLWLDQPQTLFHAKFLLVQKSPSQISSALKIIGWVTGHSQAQYIIPWINLSVIQQTQSQFYRPKYKRLRYDLKHWSKGISNLKLLIENCDKVILYPDTLEELRPLLNTEWNLRRIVKNQLMKLLQQQRK